MGQEELLQARATTAVEVPVRTESNEPWDHSKFKNSDDEKRDIRGITDGELNVSRMLGLVLSTG
jgi:hypothetical protein